MAFTSTNVVVDETREGKLRRAQVPASNVPPGYLKKDAMTMKGTKKIKSESEKKSLTKVYDLASAG